MQSCPCEWDPSENVCKLPTCVENNLLYRFTGISSQRGQSTANLFNTIHIYFSDSVFNSGVNGLQSFNIPSGLDGTPFYLCEEYLDENVIVIDSLDHPLPQGVLHAKTTPAPSTILLDFLIAGTPPPSQAAQAGLVEGATSDSYTVTLAFEQDTSSHSPTLSPSAQPSHANPPPPPTEEDCTGYIDAVKCVTDLRCNWSVPPANSLIDYYPSIYL